MKLSKMNKSIHYDHREMYDLFRKQSIKIRYNTYWRMIKMILRHVKRKLLSV